uniref:ribosomal protein S11 n=1 Tax=Dracocephalum cuspidatum TaxID=1439902 RepID=UPI002551E2A2|nr:ribosomal protein S11 [Dracocephalum cuspidatum]WEV87764.1 ribosomal protein S11 [Dracocephalum cuspidatum]
MHVLVHIKYQRELFIFMFKQVLIIPLSQLQMYEVRVISWSSAGTCRFKETRRGTPFAAQTAAANAISAISTVVDPRYATSRSRDKRPRSRKRRRITSYS